LLVPRFDRDDAEAVFHRGRAGCGRLPLVLLPLVTTRPVESSRRFVCRRATTPLPWPFS
jgi:hypothetical protein